MRVAWTLGLLLALAAPARADEPELVPTIEEAAPEESARKALEAHEAGDYRRAGEQFMRAFELSGNPTQLRNAAKSLERAGLLKQALAAWQRYLAIEGLEPTKREVAEAHVLALSAAIERDRLAAEAASPRIQDTVPPPAAPPDRLRWGLIGAGAATLGGGIALYASGYSTYAEWAERESSVTRSEASSAQVRASLGVALAIAGLAAAGLGIALPWLAEDEAAR